MPAELLQDANHFIPPAVFSRAARVTFALSTASPGRPTWNLVISNVPGPQFPLYLAGARLDANYPVSVITDGMGLNITVMSYCGTLDFGIVSDRDQMPDVLYAISKVLPLSYAIDAINAVTAGDEGWDVYGPLLVVAGFLVAALVLASLTLRRRTP